MFEKDELERSLERVHGWAKSADQKVSIFLAFQGVVVIPCFKYISANFKKFPCFYIVFLAAGVVLVLFSIGKSISAIFPRLKNHKGKKSLTYFGDIASLELNVFKKEIKKSSAEDYKNELIDQIHISSKIAYSKHRKFSHAIILFVMGMVIFGIVFSIFKVCYGN